MSQFSFHFAAAQHVWAPWRRLRVTVCLLTAGLIGLAAPLVGQEPIPPAPAGVFAAPGALEGPELPLLPGAEGGAPQVLDRGPIHEAFAEPLVDPALQGEREQAIVPKRPPEPINEIPPDAKPAGEHVQWIPGYWMWSPDKKDFVWVSGVWRNPPPGRRWVPGYWSEAGGGFAWTAGFWSLEQAQEIAFVPQPPESVEQGPSSPAPGAGYFWVPGCWIYQQTAYAWQPGFWSVAQPNWTWTPSYYCYTPSGFVFVPGYWDRPLLGRGFLYASVWWNHGGYLRPGFVYRPQALVNTGLLLAHLFVNPYHHHYYYGGWGPQYAALGYYPWLAYANRGPRYYDPLFVYHRWHEGRRNPHWLSQMQQHYRRFESEGLHDRGPSAEKLVVSHWREIHHDNARYAAKPVSPTELATVTRGVRQWRDFEQLRARAETGGNAANIKLDGATTAGAGSVRRGDGAPPRVGAKPLPGDGRPNSTLADVGVTLRSRRDGVVAGQPSTRQSFRLPTDGVFPSTPAISSLPTGQAPTNARTRFDGGVTAGRGNVPPIRRPFSGDAGNLGVGDGTPRQSWPQHAQQANAGGSLGARPAGPVWRPSGDPLPIQRAPQTGQPMRRGSFDGGFRPSGGDRPINVAPWSGGQNRQFAPPRAGGWDSGQAAPVVRPHWSGQGGGVPFIRSGGQGGGAHGGGVPMISRGGDGPGGGTPGGGGRFRGRDR